MTGTTGGDSLSFWLMLGIGVILLVLIAYVIERFWLRVRRAETFENLVILQVLMPRDIPNAKDSQEEQRKDFREMIAVAEQMFAAIAGTYRRGIMGWFAGQPRFSFEIIAKDGKILFYVGMPRQLRSYVEKQIQGYYPDAHLKQMMAL